jgi:hypothetical protein
MAPKHAMKTKQVMKATEKAFKPKGCMKAMKATVTASQPDEGTHPQCSLDGNMRSSDASAYFSKFREDPHLSALAHALALVLGGRQCNDEKACGRKWFNVVTVQEACGRHQRGLPQRTHSSPRGEYPRGYVIGE